MILEGSCVIVPAYYDAKEFDPTKLQKYSFASITSPCAPRENRRCLEVFVFGRISSLFSLFLSPGGLLALSFIDSSIFFFTPFASDLVVVLLVARGPDSFWIYPLVAIVGSLLGLALTFWFGRKAGKAGLRRFVPKRKLEKVSHRLKNKGAFAAGALAIAPPPFPFTALVLAAGALDVSFLKFMATAALMRVLRYGAAALLARRYGESIVGWTESSFFKGMVGFLIAIALAGTAYAIYQALSSRREAG
jgi:membrane protein YqaA with SNARE-associated domain